MKVQIRTRGFKLKSEIGNKAVVEDLKSKMAITAHVVTMQHFFMIIKRF